MLLYYWNARSEFPQHILLSATAISVPMATKRHASYHACGNVVEWHQKSPLTKERERKEDLMEKESIVRYWHAVELLQPQSAPKIQRRSENDQAFFHDTPSTDPVPPWAPESIVGKQVLPDKSEWSHTLYAYLYDSRLVADALKRLYGFDQGYREPQYRQSALFAAKFTMAGQFVEDSFTLSSEAWFVGRALTGQDWTYGFADAQRIAAEQAQTQLQGDVSGAALRDFVLWVLGFLGVAELFQSTRPAPLRFRSQPIQTNKPVSGNDPLNSFLLDDLARVADSVGKGQTSKALEQYLSGDDLKPRLHMDADIASLPQIERLMPQAYADSCWPSVKHLGLVHSQQLAVNTVLSELADGQGLLGINGPPGTGKTTLLRDLIAAIITNRADTLADLPRASDAFIENKPEVGNDGGKRKTVHKLNPSLFGFEIVVASSNNGAVENVTLELPQRDKVDESWLPEAEYFADLGELITGKPAWGMISGTLGSKARRSEFVSAYFYGQKRRDEQGFDDESDAIEPEDDGNVSETLVAGLASTSEADTEQTSLHEVKAAPKGLMDWLGTKVQRNKGLTSERRQAIWQQVVAEYKAAKANVGIISADARRISTLIQDLLAAKNKIAEAIGRVQTLEKSLARTREQQTRLEVSESQTNAAFKDAMEALAQHQVDKPGIWKNLSSLWGASRAWRAKLKLMQDRRDHAKVEFNRVARLGRKLEASCQQLERQIHSEQQASRKWQLEDKSLTEQASDLAASYRADHLLAWLRSGVIGSGDAIELAEPWNIDGWRQARARVLIKALKLHRTFFELEPKRMRSNLFMVNAMLTGSCFDGLSRDAIRSAWASLFMVVPVLSSTFDSFARSFSSLGCGEIGWLLVDKAGQAKPQAAVGALWRSRRALLVGDPLQLKPIVSVSDAVLEHMRTRYRVDARWLPNRQSAQILADQITTWGRMVGPDDSKIWVGMPLVVHRRCDKPMYEIANRIAYDGAMVYGTIAPSADEETRARLPTGWVHVSGSSDGNWVPAEGEALQILLTCLRKDGVNNADISVITPFRAVHDKLKDLIGEQMVSGTIHRMQGKDAPVVITVLGGDTQNPGARNWAVSEPNLLNVAATRAKRRFYVIGDYNDWKNRALFCDVMDLLPLQRLPEQKF